MSRYTHFYLRYIQHTYKESRMTNKSSKFADFHREFQCFSIGRIQGSANFIRNVGLYPTTREFSRHCFPNMGFLSAT
jgi:hypothetical protein